MDRTWDAVLCGESGLAAAQPSTLPEWAGQYVGALKDFQPAKALPDRKLIKVISRHDAMGIYAASEAIAHSQMIAYRDSLIDSTDFNDQTGVYVGSPGNKYFQQDDFLPLVARTQGDMQAFAENLFNDVHPMWLLRILPNNVLAYTGITYQLKGVNHNITNHAVSSTQALIEAFHAIRQGQIERAVVVGYDTAIEQQALLYYQALGVISQHGLKPFDVSHDGTVLAEGACAIVLESEQSVRARGAHCYAELLGGTVATEGRAVFGLQETGDALARLITQTLVGSGLQAEDIAMVVAHGNGNVRSDDSEAHAINACFGENAVPVTGFKWATGHLVAASGISDAVLTVKALAENVAPGIANFTQPAAAATGLSLSASHRVLSKGAKALLINRGFASMNACLVLAACD